MEFKEGSVLYVRIDYKVGEEEVSEQEAQDSADYLQGIAEERYLTAGVFGNMELMEVDGAMVLYEAKDLEEAKRIADNDPIIKGGLYRYELHIWNVMILPKP